jgi:hypothetical protein
MADSDIIVSLHLVIPFISLAALIGFHYNYTEEKLKETA